MTHGSPSRSRCRCRRHGRLPFADSVPARIVTVGVRTSTLPGAVLTRSTVMPPAGAAAGILTGKEAVLPNGTFNVDGTVRTFCVTVTVRVPSLYPGALARTNVVPAETPLSTTSPVVPPAGMLTVFGGPTVTKLVLSEVTVAVTPPAGAAAGRVTRSVAWRPAPRRLVPRSSSAIWFGVAVTVTSSGALSTMPSLTTRRTTNAPTTSATNDGALVLAFASVAALPFGRETNVHAKVSGLLSGSLEPPPLRTTWLPAITDSIRSCVGRRRLIHRGDVDRIGHAGELAVAHDELSAVTSGDIGHERRGRRRWIDQDRGAPRRSQYQRPGVGDRIAIGVARRRAREVDRRLEGDVALVRVLRWRSVPDSASSS